MSRTKVAVLFGGRSPEHWISVKSGLFVLLHLDRSRYDVEAVYVKQNGQTAGPEEYHAAVDRFFRENSVQLFREPIGDWRALLDESAGPAEPFLLAAARRRWDVLFPVFHGRFGEDGTFQGLAETLRVPYAGCDFRASALGMDKILTKKIAAAHGLAVAPYREVHRDEWQRHPHRWGQELGDALGWPMFVKPARLGSSIGVGRATDPATLQRALRTAFDYDYRVLVESEIRGSEYAVGVLGDGASTETSVIAEYTSQPEAFDYDTKYGAQALEDIIPARLSPADTNTMLTFAQDVFRALGARGISRVDSFWGQDGPVLNEVNTMPGLNPGSPFVVAWRKAGVDEKELLTRIVELGRKGPWASLGR